MLHLPHDQYQFHTQNAFTPSKDPSHSTLHKISNFLQMNNIDLQSFWKSDKNYASPDDILIFCKSVGLVLSIHQKINLKAEIFAEKEIIFIEKFVNFIHFWKEQSKEAISEFLKLRSDQILDKLQLKNHCRPKSGEVLRNQQKLISRPSTSTINKNKREGGSLVNNSKRYLKRYEEKQVFREKELNENIERNKVDEEYKMLLKMSQLNEINKKRTCNEAYRAYKSAEGTIKVRVFHLNKFEKEVTLKEFDTIYKNYKKTTKENKEWTIPQEQISDKGNDECNWLRKKNIEKCDRQQELKTLLVNTVNLTNLLKEQIKIFKEKGIYGSEDM